MGPSRYFGILRGAIEVLFSPKMPTWLTFQVKTCIIVTEITKQSFGQILNFSIGSPFKSSCFLRYVISSWLSLHLEYHRVSAHEPGPESLAEVLGNVGTHVNANLESNVIYHPFHEHIT